MSTSEKPPSRLPRRSELEASATVARRVLEIAREVFGGDRALVDFVASRLARVREVVSRPSVVYSTELETKGVIPGSRVATRPPRTHVTVRGLDGAERVVPASPDDLHFATVSRYRMKCTCKDAVITSSTAGKRLEKYLRDIGYTPPARVSQVFSKYCFCIHTLALLAKSVACGEIDLSDPEVERTLRIAMLGAYLRASREHSKEVLARLLRDLDERGELR